MATSPSAAPPATSAQRQGKSLSKSHELHTRTLTSPEFSYAVLELLTDNDTGSTSSNSSAQLDDLQVLFLCRAALERFLGHSGLAIAIDVLKVQSRTCWVRVPRQDLSAFAAALAAYSGRVEDAGGEGRKERRLLKVRRSADWLGCLMGEDDVDGLGKGALWGGF